MTQPSAVSKGRKAKLPELGFLVRVPGKPWKVRAYAFDEPELAQAYAAEQGGTVEPLPTD